MIASNEVNLILSDNIRFSIVLIQSISFRTIHNVSFIMNILAEYELLFLDWILDNSFKNVCMFFLIDKLPLICCCVEYLPVENENKK